MPFIVIEKSTGRIVATINRDDIRAWLSLMDVPLPNASDYRTERIPGMTILQPRPLKPPGQSDPSASP